MTKPSPQPGAELFSATAQRVVDYLNRTTPLADWSVTRVSGGEQVHVHVHRGQAAEVGLRSDWDDSFCRRMVDGAAPVVVDTLADPDYADVPLAPDFRAYAGVPLVDDRGEMFGVLCGFGTDPMSSVDEVDEELLALMGSLLSGQLAAARIADRTSRAAQMAEALAHTDSLTGLTNRRGWDSLVDDAERRVNAYGDSVAVIVVDLDGLKDVNDQLGHGAGDRVITAVGAALAAAAPRGDRVARYGGDEFAILVNNVPTDDLQGHIDTYRKALADAGAPASIGHAVAGPRAHSLSEAFAAADRAMYEDKDRRRVADHDVVQLET